MTRNAASRAHDYSGLLTTNRRTGDEEWFSLGVACKALWGRKSKELKWGGPFLYLKISRSVRGRTRLEGFITGEKKKENKKRGEATQESLVVVGPRSKISRTRGIVSHERQ